jgi:hypothetical protein
MQLIRVVFMEYVLSVWVDPIPEDLKEKFLEEVYGATVGKGWEQFAADRKNPESHTAAIRAVFGLPLVADPE